MKGDEDLEKEIKGQVAAMVMARGAQGDGARKGEDVIK